MRNARWIRLTPGFVISGLALMVILSTPSCVTDSSATFVCESGRRCPPGWHCPPAADGTGVEEDVCIPAGCGDGFIDRGSGEVCDDGNRSAGDGCSADCLILEQCGNNRIDEGEECEECDEDEGEECDEDEDEHEETATCDIDCTKPMCGDMHHNPLFVNPKTGVTEECDTGEDTATCDVDCTLPRCGDMHLNPFFVNPDTGIPEQCDEGGVNESDCDEDCTLPMCGDGFHNPRYTVNIGDDMMPYPEECDDGNDDNTDFCVLGCRQAVCGDGYLWAGVEECDDGNDNQNDGCPSGKYGGCRAARCGDGFVWIGEEQCDDGNGNNADLCPDGPGGTCQFARCGDGFLQIGVEECDDGNENTSDACPSGMDLKERGCRAAFCGDGFTHDQAGGRESCDEGEDNSDDPNAKCRPDCQLRRCGDGIHDDMRGEECDDGDGDTGDACPDGPGGTCKVASCGDGFLRVGVEECEPAEGEMPDPDDIPADSADCDSDCTIATCGDNYVNSAAGEECEVGVNCEGGKVCVPPGEPDQCKCVE